MKKSGFQFNNPVLVKMNYELNEHYDPEQPQPPEIRISTNVTVKNLEDNDRSAMVVLELTIDPENENYPYRLTAAMGAYFRWDAEMTKKMTESTRIVVGISAALYCADYCGWSSAELSHPIYGFYRI